MMCRHTAMLAGLLFSIAWLYLAPAHGAQAPLPPFSYRPGKGQMPESTQPPWYQTQERRPKEVKDKENETPVTACENTNEIPREKINTVTYYDSQTSTRTTIRRVITEEPRIGSPLVRTIWEILIEQAGKPKKKITYSIEPDNETRSEKTGKDKPNTRPVTGDDMYVPPVRKSSVPAGLVQPALARAVTRAIETSQPRGSARFELAAAPVPFSQRPSGNDTAAQPKGMSIVMKSDVRGEPPQLMFAISDLSPPMTADEYILSQALLQLEKEARDPEGAYYYGEIDNPGVFKPGDFFYTMDGQNIEIVGDWSLARVPGGFLMACAGFDMDDEDDDGWRLPYDLRYAT